MAYQSERSRRTTKLSWVFGSIVKIIFALVLALVASILIEIFGMHSWWEEEGILHSREMLQYEVKRFDEYDHLSKLSEIQI